MGMQTDVKQAHLNGSGFLVKSPVRVKGVSFYGAGSADGVLVLFDTSAAAAAYKRVCGSTAFGLS